MSQLNQLTSTVYGTSSDLQLVYLHEVKSVIDGNIQSVLLLMVGAALLSVQVPWSFLTLWPVGAVLIILGYLSYRHFVQAAYHDWEARKFPLGGIPSNIGQSYTQSGTGPPRNIYA